MESDIHIERLYGRLYKYLYNANGYIFLKVMRVADKYDRLNGSVKIMQLLIKDRCLERIFYYRLDEPTPPMLQGQYFRLDYSKIYDTLRSDEPKAQLWKNI